MTKQLFQINDIVMVKGNSTPLRVIDWGVKYGHKGCLKLRYENTGRVKKQFVHYSALKLIYRAS
jgi:hypothetical protein